MKERDTAGAALAAGAEDPSAFSAEPARPKFVDVIRRQRHVVAAVVGLCVLVAFIYLLSATRLYTSQSQILLQQSGDHATPSQDATLAFLNSQRTLLTSTNVLGIVVGKPGVANRPSLKGVDNVLAYLKTSLRVDVDAKDYTMTVALDAPVAGDASALVNDVVDAFVTHHTRQRDAAQGELKTELADVDAQIAAKNDSILLLKSDAATLSFDTHDSNVMQTLQKLKEALTAESLNRLSAESAFTEAIAAYPKDPEHLKMLDEIERAGSIATSELEGAQVRDSIFEAEQKMQELTSTYGPRHPQVRAMQTRLDNLRAVHVIATKRRMTLAQEREAKLTTAVAAQEKVAQDFAGKAAEYDRLVADVRRLEKQAEAIGQRQIRVNDDAAALTLTVLDHAHPADRASSPEILATLALALLLGAALGIAGAYGNEVISPRLYTADEVKANLHLPVLGLVPRLPEPEVDEPLIRIISSDPLSEAAEAYRTVRTALRFAGPEGAGKVLLVASPADGDGKTTFAAGLAMVLAQGGKRVLLVDADFRNPGQHALFDAEWQLGLSSVLQDEETLETAIQRTQVEGVDILPSGIPPTNPAELLNGHKLAEMLAEVAKKYDHVVLDSPAVMGVSDARIISACCDATLLVIRAGKTDRRVAERACDGLLSVGARIVGVVLNDLPSTDPYETPPSFGNPVTRPALAEATDPAASATPRPTVSVKVKSQSELSRRFFGLRS